MPSDATPLAAPGVLGQGLKWMLDRSSPFYIAPRPSPALARWLWLFRAACSEKRAQAAAPVLRALHVASARLHDELAAERGERWLFHHDGELQVFETPTGLAAAAEDVERARAMGARVDEVTAAEARRLFPSLRCELAGAFFFPEDGHLDPLRFTRAIADSGRGGRRDGSPRASRHSRSSRRRERRARDHDARRGRGRAGRAGRRRLDAAADPRDSACVCRSSRQRATASTWTGPTASPSCRSTWATPTSSSRRSATSLRLGSTLELSGWDMRVRPRRVAYLREGGRRAIGLPADGPVRQLWRGPRPVTPDGLPVIGRVPGRDRVILATGHCMLGLSLGPVTGRLVAQLAGGATPDDRPGAALAAALQVRAGSPRFSP